MPRTTPLLQLDRVRKEYTHGRLRKQVTFSLEADITFAEPAIVGVLGPNGAGKSTLFELMTGSNRPTAGKVYCNGQNIHKVRYRERDRLAIHYHQSYQVRRIKRTTPSMFLEHARSDYPLVHLFDEPQFNPQDGYIGFMLDFFRTLRRAGRLVFVCLHPTERYHLEILREICEGHIFVQQGRLHPAPDWHALLSHPPVRAYLGHLADDAARRTP